MFVGFTMRIKLQCMLAPDQNLQQVEANYSKLT